MDDHFAVRGGLKNRAAALQPFAQLGEVDQVAVVRDGQSAAGVLDHQRLAILERGRALGGVAVVADRQGAFQALDHLAVEDVRDQAHPAMADQRLAVGRDDSSRLLSPMLQRVQPQVNQVGGFGMAINAEDSALLVEVVQIGFFELGRKLGCACKLAMPLDPPGQRLFVNGPQFARRPPV